jgi:integrase
LKIRRGGGTASEWVFPSTTRSGHIESSTRKKQHQSALAASGVSPFVVYDLRHTCLTRWAKTLDPFTLMKLAGHADLSTTMRYVHLNDDDVRAAIQKSELAKGGHKIGHSNEQGPLDSSVKRPLLN